ncbi:hypothetical protein JCM30237_15840 [Halolamina litorea]|uniref:PAS domain-containing protein n=1 Tax=Halolamina litorea TaxID=1515593 RepID=A0ABD6BMM2_9EURY|nr:PAS domain-containing protein [Halolamina litorea]
MANNPPEERRVLLRMRDGENRRLLGEWLADEPGYQPIVADSDDAFNAEFDCAILDTATLPESGDNLAARRRMEPVFLPVLLLLPKRTGGDALKALEQLPGHVRSSVDDTIEAPVQKRALRHRLDTLVRAREYAEQLNRSRDRYHRLLEMLPEAVLLLRDGATEYVNEAAISLLEREEPHLIGDHPVTYVAPEDQPALARYLRELRNGRGETGVKVEIVADGERVPVEFRGVRLFEEDDDGDDEPLVQLLIHEAEMIDGEALGQP